MKTSLASLLPVGRLASLPYRRHLGVALLIAFVSVYLVPGEWLAPFLALSGWLALCAVIRRLHDAGQSRLWSLTPFVLALIIQVFWNLWDRSDVIVFLLGIWFTVAFPIATLGFALMLVALPSAGDA